jgi:hypothetical protein
LKPFPFPEQEMLSQGMLSQDLLSLGILVQGILLHGPISLWTETRLDSSILFHGLSTLNRLLYHGKHRLQRGMERLESAARLGLAI